MDQKSESAAKWEGKVSTMLQKTSADKIWPLFTDFFNFHKWFPSLATCYGVHGTNGEPGCIRYCAGFSIPSADGAVSWSKERLTAVDPQSRCLSYEMVDGNIGFRSYVSTVRVRGGDGEGCVIEWEFGVEPVEGMGFEDMVRKYEVGLKRMGQKMEDALRSSGRTALPNAEACS